ncbi:myosin-binding protein 2-like [Gossypium australe]|uniref:Myosin-binding protein 2-like n=1 Tax=Gossypium australe TaxID=47621 RepID=A0A5B6VAJ4_9ROSI|nr:myosin-binding protein 2-like [Gossypium australe]
MLHKNTNRITLILVYVLLEWILIVLLLLNSLFSYLIIKFADYFGLKRPCLWCSRLDHIFEPSKYNKSYRDLVCDDHANEISKLGFCSNHRKLSESRDMCEDCLSSSPSENVGDEVMENGDEDFKCSCCGVMVEKKWNLPCFMIKPSWEVLDYPQEGNLITEGGEKVEGIIADEGNASDGIRSDFVADHKDEQMIKENKRVGIISDDEGIEQREVEKEEFSYFVSSFDCNQVAANGDEDDVVIEKDQSSVNGGDLTVSMADQGLTQFACAKVESPEILNKHLEFYIGGDDCHLIPVELMDSTAMRSQKIYKFTEEDEDVAGTGDVILDFDLQQPGTPVELVVENGCSSAEKVTPLSPHVSEEKTIDAVDEPMEPNGKEGFSTPAVEQDLMEIEDDQHVATTQANMPPLNEADDVQPNATTREEEINLDVNQAISIGTDVVQLNETIEDIQMQHLYECTQGDPSTSSELHANADRGSKDVEEETMQQLKTATFERETSDQPMKNHLSLSSELNDIEEDKVPDTPTSIDSLHLLHKKLLLLDRKESGTEDSLDGSVFSDIEGGDGVLTVDKLKSALKTERKALNALYRELEEERSASAVAANQTMAMINRLQEEKAAMQMEAVQYQRMMEEQSEYDQEALQILNELMVKREKEKAELEKELEIYRKKEEDSFENHQIREDVNQNTPADAVLYLEESLANFEEERLSILEQLKVLEEQLISLNDEEEQQHFEDIKSVEYLYEDNGNGFHEIHNFGHETNGVANGHFKGVNGKHHQDKIIPMATKAKRLLPLFDATDAETEEKILNGHENGFDSVALQHTLPELENKMITIEEEVDHVYERLQALEADREFLKHCISSLRKGDKGIYLLQEILQHLRDLRSVELRVRSNGDAAI